MGHPLAVGGEKGHPGGLPEKAQSRRLSAAYTLKLLEEAAGCPLGALLRREGAV